MGELSRQNQPRNFLWEAHEYNNNNTGGHVEAGYVSAVFHWLSESGRNEMGHLVLRRPRIGLLSSSLQPTGVGCQAGTFGSLSLLVGLEVTSFRTISVYIYLEWLGSRDALR